METNKINDYIKYRAHLYLSKRNIKGVKAILEEANTISNEKISKLIKMMVEKTLTLKVLTFFLIHKITDDEFEEIALIFNNFPNPNEEIINNLLNKGYKNHQMKTLYKLYDEEMDTNIVKILSQIHIPWFQIEVLASNYKSFKFNEEEMVFFASEENLKKAGYELNTLMQITAHLKSSFFSLKDKEKIINWFSICNPNNKNRADADIIEKIISNLAESTYKNSIKDHLEKNITLKDLVYFEDMLVSPDPDFYRKYNTKNNNSSIRRLEKADTLFSLMTAYKTIKEKPANEVLLDYITKFNPLKTLEPIALK